MAGAFDFYVDESLLEQLFGGGDAKKGKPGGDQPAGDPSTGDKKADVASVPVAAPPPTVQAPGVAVAEPAPAPILEKVEEKVEKTVAGADTATSAAIAPIMPTAEHEALGMWREADALYAAGDYAAAAGSYVRAALASESSTSEVPEAAQASTLRYNAAICELAAGRLEAAQEHLELAAQSAPESRMVRLALAVVCFRRNQYNDATGHCDRILASHPADEEALLGKIQALSSAGDLDGANAVCEVFHSQHPTNPLALEAAIAVAVARKDKPAVQQAAQQLRELVPDSVLAAKVLAAISIADRNFEAAADHCEALLAKPDTDFDAYLHAAETLQQAGRADKALEAASRAVQLNPGSYEALLRLAESQQKLQLWAEARDSYQKAVELHPDSPDAFWNLALVLEELGSYDPAAEALTVAVRLRPNWEDASLRLASLHAAANRFAEASAVLEHCLLLRKDWPEALFLSGIVLHHLGQSGPAQDAVLKALEYKPDETAWIESLERIAVDRDDALVALDCHEKLAEANIETPEMAYNLGVVLQKENEPELAAKCYVRALEQRPDFELALLNLGYALRDLGREEEARACWGKAVRLDPSLAAGYFE